MKTETYANGTNLKDNGNGAGGSRHCFALSPAPVPVSPGEGSDGEGIGMFCSVGRAELSVKDIPECLKAVKKVADAENVYIICLNADCIAGYGHIESAVFHAKRSWYEDKPIANSFEMEVLLYTGARRQCNEIGEFGLHKGNNDLFVCVCEEMKNKVGNERDGNKHGKDENKNEKYAEYCEKNEKVFSELEREIGLKLKNGDDSGNIGDGNDRISDRKLKKLMKLFDIPDEELSEVGIGRIEELIVEKVALLDIQK
ncbi:KEOPS complex subunit Cgi121 [Methanomicrobium mobile]|uniref:KEOPS complex subunit Cgi121 n=1 Tax=Methanomicrobium mobile TaxID=2205 RepID=UPI0005B25FCD|nr:KEOPS complex subunit Cgi121 [Methanomicrobium mobile]